MICPNCKKEIDDDFHYCPQCGMKIEKCSQCHQPIIKGGKYCSYCGAPLQNQYQDTSIGGYYQPLEDIHDDISTQPKSSFQKIKVSQKINKKVIGISLIVLALLTTVSYAYLKSTENQNIFQSQTVPEEVMEIKGDISDVSKIGNINQSSHVAVYKDRILMIDDEGNLISMNQKLEDRQTLVKGDVEYLQVENDVIYYTDENHYICSISIDGKDQKIILNKEAYYVFVKDQKIYYQLDSDGEKIYIYDLNTHTNHKINDRQSYHLNIINNDIYYTSTDGIYRIGIDGQGDEKLVSGKVYGLLYKDQKLYYSTSDYKIHCYDIGHQKIETIIDEKSQLMNIVDNDMFYYSQEGLKRYNLDSQKTKTIYNGSIEYCEIVGDKLVVTIEIREEEYRMIMDFDGVNQQRLFVNSNDQYV